MMWNSLRLTFFVTLSALSVSLVQSRVVPPQSVSPAQSSEPGPPLPAPSNNNLFIPDFYKFLNSDSVSTEGNNPDPRPSVWVALGDSFAAGSGAGDDIQDGSDCVRGSMNYPLQMQADANIPGPNGPNSQKPMFTLKACTGDVTTDLTNQQNPNYQLGEVRHDTSFVTLSIGGNDIKFVDILKKCVFGIPPGILGPSCDTFLSISHDILFGQEFHDHYNDVIIGILSNMDWENRGSSRTAIYQTSYSQFFDSYTDQCDGVSFYVLEFFGPKITKDLRIKLNRLTHEVNYVISYYADLLNVHHSRAVGNPSLFSSAISFVDVDISYNGHRFCRQGVNEPAHHNPDTHFFNLNLLASTDGKNVTVSDTNMPIPRENATADWIDANYGHGVHAEWVWVMKTFHPNPAGFTHTKDVVLYPKLQFREAMRFWGSTSSRDVDLVVLGDYVAFASQDANSPIYQGIIPHLKAIFRNHRYYNMAPGSGVHVRPTFSGSQKPNNANSEFHECYKIATIDELHDNFVGSPDFSTQNKVILLMAGTIDVLYDIDLEHWPDRYTSLIHDIFDSDPDAKVFAGHIPMIGYNPEGPFKWFGLHKRIALFNARLNALVDQLATEHGYRIMTVYTSATTREHLDGDLLLPNTRGYLRIALNFVEHMAMAALMGWFDSGSRGPQNGVGSIGIGSQFPARPGDNDTLVVDKGTCNQEFEFVAGQGIPTKEDTLKSILRGASMDDFITNVACNADEICKWAVDEIHGDKTDFPSANGTVCVTAGGASDKADYNQLIVVRPDASYDLGRGSCKDAVQSILNDCILSGKFYGGYFKGKDGLYIEQKDLNFPQNPTLDNGFALPNIPNDVVQSALDGPAPTTTFKPSLPFVTVTGIICVG